MKVVLSRKGFDSSCGGCASPIFEDGSFLSLPIPYRSSGASYSDILFNGAPIDKLVSDLTRGRVGSTAPAHLDPDLRPDALPRDEGWRPLFGQTDAAQRHLERHNVGPGDVFLFFGWFREVRLRGGRYSYVPRAPNLHVIFGWLEVGEVWRPRGEAGPKFPAWAARHPHLKANLGSCNTVYAGSAGGAFEHAAENLILTAPGTTRRTEWRLPSWFLPDGRASVLSYHSKPTRWTEGSSYCSLVSAGRGQEFVLDADHYPEARSWVTSFLK
jgi:hypothetical protein